MQTRHIYTSPWSRSHRIHITQTQLQRITQTQLHYVRCMFMWSKTITQDVDIRQRSWRHYGPSRIIIYPHSPWPNRCSFVSLTFAIAPESHRLFPSRFKIVDSICHRTHWNRWSPQGLWQYKLSPFFCRPAERLKEICCYKETLLKEADKMRREGENLRVSMAYGRHRQGAVYIRLPVGRGRKTWWQIV